ncbi:type I pullulanase [Maribacter cobaltidurans]|uniref:Type I pullulanase n=1 Tax=Maribacter cobaltidurans TaxID=1178778 RepID=A0A223V7B1_9FLAO|nr:type I pullulanase [Maribacter cobaltidurans]ASV31182.1 type I pullulanase [Maribacter cobaltidurans]GGD84437.1 type I pullulanase [Maribacter cobaltidurans]
MKLFSILLISTVLIISCNPKIDLKNYDAYPTAYNVNLWPHYTKDATDFKLWAPTAEEVKLNLYSTGNDADLLETHQLTHNKNGVWNIKIKGDLNGTYYTFQVKIGKTWLNETPGIYAKAVGVNGNKAMVLDMKTTNPLGWENDEGPTLETPNKAIIYELHVRDMTIHPQSGVKHKGKFLCLVEQGAKGPEGIKKGIDHLKDLGITHVHLLPSFDHYSIDETNLDTPQFNWGYDPKNYNVPEGSYSTDPYNAEVRIKEFKQMVKSFHDNGIGVILDVVYNHTGKTEESLFNQEVPGYYYRHNEDGSYSDAAACGNETASERSMMRKFMLESLLYWTQEYHIDGFRFDLMGIHDVDTMNEIAQEIKKVNPDALLYGEGWTAKDSPLPEEKRALKKHMQQLQQIAAFSDDIRDGLKGSVFDDMDTGFVSGARGKEESIKFGVIGGIQHSQINYDSINYSKAPWAKEPWQSISYTSCHDNHTLFDKLMISKPDSSEEEIKAMHKLANAIVLTSQGIPFLHAGVEFLRSKNGEHNSYNLPDSVNQIDWNQKVKNMDVFNYYKNLISLRKKHPAFSISNGNEVQEHLKFQTVKNGVISFSLDNNANDDSWKEILVIYNANQYPYRYTFKDTYHLSVFKDDFDFEGQKIIKDFIDVPAISMAIAFKK